MATWFIRLGVRNANENEALDKALYQALAKEHNLIKIGYAIDRDITGKRDQKEIAEYLEKYLSDHMRKLGKPLTAKRIEVRSRLINEFINGISKGDTIISEFDDSYMKVGKVVSKCCTVESFFDDKKELDDFLKKHTGAKEQQNQKIKPAIKVEWDSKEMELNDFSEELQNELRKNLRPTVNKLKSEYKEPEKNEYNTGSDEVPPKRSSVPSLGVMAAVGAAGYFLYKFVSR